MFSEKNFFQLRIYILPWKKKERVLKDLDSHLSKYFLSLIKLDEQFETLFDLDLQTRNKQLIIWIIRPTEAHWHKTQTFYKKGITKPGYS